METIDDPVRVGISIDARAGLVRWAISLVDDECQQRLEQPDGAVECGERVSQTDADRR